MPRQFDFSALTGQETHPFFPLHQGSELPISEKESEDRSVFGLGVALEHYRIDVRTDCNYSRLNEYLNDAYRWLDENCIHRFDWEESAVNEYAQWANGQEKRLSRFSIMVNFESEADARNFAEIFADFQRSECSFTGEKKEFELPERLPQKFARAARNMTNKLTGQSPERHIGSNAPHQSPDI